MTLNLLLSYTLASVLVKTGADCSRTLLTLLSASGEIVCMLVRVRAQGRATFRTFLYTVTILRRAVKIADWLFYGEKKQRRCTIVTYNLPHPNPMFHSMVPIVCLLSD